LFKIHALWACSTCMVGDPTQTLMGAEKPYEDRLRLSLDVLTRDESTGVAGFNQKKIDETRSSINLAYAPNRRMMFALHVPVVKRTLESFNLSTEEVTALGDVSLTFKNFMQEKDSFQRHMYGLIAGLRLPTATEQTANGVPLDFDVQPGTGAYMVNAGAWYAQYRFPWMFYTSTSYFISGEGNQKFQAGDAIVLNASLQYAAHHGLSFPLALEARWSQQDKFAEVVDPNSGGTQVYLAPGVIYNLADDLLLNFAIKLPVVENLNGDHEEGTIVTFGVTYDFDMHE
jgi:hypothetical protein